MAFIALAKSKINKTFKTKYEFLFLILVHPIDSTLLSFMISSDIDLQRY
jgi:hypothetical protein